MLKLIIKIFVGAAALLVAWEISQFIMGFLAGLMVARYGMQWIYAWPLAEVIVYGSIAVLGLTGMALWSRGKA